MPWRIDVQPNGLLARFSTVVDDFTDYDMMEVEAIDLCENYLGREDARKKVQSGIEAGHARFDEDIETVRFRHGDAIAKERMQEMSKPASYQKQKHYTWEEKIESLVTLAKAAGRYINSEETDLLEPRTRSDYYHDAQRKFREAYADFCEWRHDEPYVVDEIKALLARYEVSPLTGQVVQSIKDENE